METDKTNLIIAAYQSDNKLVRAFPYRYSTSVDTAICNTLDTLFCDKVRIDILELRCFQCPDNLSMLQCFPEPNKELCLFLQNLTPTLTVDAIQAYWLYKNGYKVTFGDFDTHIKEKIILYKKYLQAVEQENSTTIDNINTDMLIVRAIIGISSPQHAIDENTIKQIGNIDSSLELEKCLSGIWQHLIQMAPENAEVLLKTLIKNTHFKKMITTEEFTEQFDKNAQETIGTILHIAPNKLNSSQKTLLAVHLCCAQEDLQNIKDIETEYKAAIQFGSSIMSKVNHPFISQLQLLHNEQTKKENESAEIRKVLFPVADKPENAMDAETILAKLTDFFKAPHIAQLNDSITYISQCDSVAEPKITLTKVLSAFYQSNCWIEEPDYAFAVQSSLLNKLTQLNEVPFPTDLQKISRLQIDEIPSPDIFKYIQVLASYISYSDPQGLQQELDFLHHCEKNLSTLSENIRKPLLFIPIFSKALTTGITTFLTQNEENDRQQFINATNHFGLDNLLIQVQYRLGGGLESEALVQSRYAETLLFNAITLLTQAIPHACNKNLLFKGWHNGLVDIKSNQCHKSYNTCARLSTKDNSEVIHAIFGNTRETWTEIDLLLDHFISMYQGNLPTKEEVSNWFQKYIGTESTDLSLSPGIVFLFRQEKLLSYIIQLNQLRIKARKVNNLFDKEKMCSDITELIHTIKSMSSILVN